MTRYEQVKEQFPPGTPVQLLEDTKTHAAGATFTVDSVREFGAKTKLVWVIVKEPDGVHSATFAPEQLSPQKPTENPTERTARGTGPTSDLFAERTADTVFAEAWERTSHEYLAKFGEFDGYAQLEALPEPWDLDTRKEIAQLVTGASAPQVTGVTVEELKPKRPRRTKAEMEAARAAAASGLHAYAPSPEPGSFDPPEQIKDLDGLGRGFVVEDDHGRLLTVVATEAHVFVQGDRFMRFTPEQVEALAHKLMQTIG